MWMLLLSVAVAQDDGPSSLDCQRHSSIAGTAGFENARSANETNALAYGAVRFVQEDVSEMLLSAEERTDDGDWVGAYANQAHVALGVTRVPSVELSSGCPSNLRVSSRPLDLGGTRIGLAGSNGTFGFFYSGAVTYGITPNDATERFFSHTNGYVFGLAGAMGAPVLGGALRFNEGASVVFTDFVLGGTVDPGPFELKAGWVGSKGLFADIEGEVPLFAAAVFDRLGLDGNLLEGGLRKLQSEAGLTSVFAKNQPFRSLPSVGAGNDPVERQDAPSLDFTTGHLEHYEIGGIVDVRASYALRPSPALHEATVAVHTPRFWSEPKPGRVIARAGVIQLPDMWFYGVRGGLRPTVHLEYVARTPIGSNPHANLHIAGVLDINAPEQLLLFPYAVNAVFIGYEFKGSF